MAISDYANPRQVIAQTSGFRNLSDSMNNFGKAALSFQDRDLARQLNERQDTQLGLNKRRLEMDEQRQRADMAEEARQREIEQNVRQGIIGADKQRVGFNDDAAAQINDRYNLLTENHKDFLTALDTKRSLLKADGNEEQYDGQGNIVRTKESLALDAEEKANQAKYDQELNRLNLGASSLYNQSPVDNTAYGQNVYDAVINGGGTIEQASKAQKSITDRDALTPQETARLNIAQNQFTSQLEAAKQGIIKQSDKSGTGAGSTTTSSKKTNYINGASTRQGYKNIKTLTNDLSAIFPNDTFTVRSSKAEAKDLPSYLSNIGKTAITINGTKYYPTDKQVMESAYLASDGGNWVANPALRKKTFEEALEKRIRSDVAQGNIMGRSGKYGFTSEKTYSPNARETSRNIKTAQQNYERNVLDIIGRGGKVTKDQVNKAFDGLFGTKSKTERTIPTTNTKTTNTNVTNTKTNNIKTNDAETDKIIEKHIEDNANKKVEDIEPLPEKAVDKTIEKITSDEKTSQDFLNWIEDSYKQGYDYFGGDLEGKTKTAKAIWDADMSGAEKALMIFGLMSREGAAAATGAFTVIGNAAMVTEDTVATGINNLLTRNRPGIDTNAAGTLRNNIIDLFDGSDTKKVDNTNSTWGTNQPVRVTNLTQRTNQPVGVNNTNSTQRTTRTIPTNLRDINLTGSVNQSRSFENNPDAKPAYLKAIQNRPTMYNPRKIGEQEIKRNTLFVLDRYGKPVPLPEGSKPNRNTMTLKEVREYLEKSGS